MRRIINVPYDRRWRLRIDWSSLEIESSKLNTPTWYLVRDWSLDETWWRLNFSLVDAINLAAIVDSIDVTNNIDVVVSMFKDKEVTKFLQLKVISCMEVREEQDVNIVNDERDYHE